MVTLLTPTRNRPEAFDLLQSWIERQTYREPLQWIVVNDGDTIYNYRCDQTVIRREAGRQEMHSLCMNLLAGLPLVEGTKLLIVEDDDYLAPEYVEQVCTWLEENEMTGSRPAIYFHLQHRTWRIMRNHSHASLGQTGLRASAIPHLVRAIQVGTPNLDLRLWRDGPADRMLHRNLTADGRVLHVGMKGLRGEPGIGVGHRMKDGTKDSDFTQLRKWVGDEVAEIYAQVFPKGNTCAR